MIMKNIISTLMKTNKILSLFAVVTLIFVVTSCVQDDDYSVPNSLGQEENAGLQAIIQAIDAGTLTEISIADLKALYAGQTELIESEIVVKGYVSSSDRTGNFYKEFYLQDSPENPTAAMGVSLNQVDSYNQFNFGREVYIYLKDLYLGENSSDVVSIGGGLDDNNLGEMSVNQISTHVFRSPNTMQIVPVMAAPSDVNSSHLGMYITLENVQFPSEFEGSTFHNPINDFDTRYPLVSCDDGSELQLETSSFANFKQVPLPTDNRGNISGVVTQGFGGSPTVLILNSPDEIEFNDERCDPVFEESFSSAIDGTDLNLDGWVNYAEAGSEVWTEQVFSGNGYAELNPFSSGDSSNIAWLITPGIDLDAQDGEILSFQTQHAFPDAGHDPLDVLISTDYDGTEAGIATATWTELSFDVSYIVDSNTWYTFVSSGPVDISGYSGNAHIAFRYTGSDTSNQNMTLHVDNVVISVP